MKTEAFALKELERRSSHLNGSLADDPPDRSNNLFMLSGDALLLQTKACEFFIREVTTRAWRHTDLHRRKTIQKSDIWASVGESEVYDFLIDIIPRAVPSANTGTTDNNTTVGAPSTNATYAFTTANTPMIYHVNTAIPQNTEMMMVGPPTTADVVNVTHPLSVDPPPYAANGPEIAHQAFNFDNVSFVPMKQPPTALDEKVQHPMQYHTSSQPWTLEGNTNS